MYCNTGIGIFYLALLLLTYVPAGLRGGRTPPATLLRPECRAWLWLLTITYIGASSGYFLFLGGGVSATGAMWIGEVFLYLYSVLFGPVLYCTFRREQRYWRHGTRGATSLRSSLSRGSHGERLLEAAIANASNTRGVVPIVSGGGSPSSPSLKAPPGVVWSANAQAAGKLRAALGGVRVVPSEDLTVHELIGTGGFAEVFRATCSSTGSKPTSSGPSGGGSQAATAAEPAQVAVKQLRSMPRESAGLEAFCKEIALHQRLQHPNVLALHGVCISRAGALSVITPYMDLGSVFQLLHPPAGPPSPLPRVLSIRMLSDCARGMSYLHSMEPQIIHRDLKSQNLLVSADFSVKVADFGLSRECLRPGAMTRVGSVQWAAPEVLLGNSYSHKCDLWSFGVVCWEMLTARVPFDGMPQTAVATKVALEGMRLPVPHRTPICLLRLIARCWSDAPELRPSFDCVEIELQGIENILIDEGEPDQPFATLSSSPPPPTPAAAAP
jgi:hypothetical protein